MAEQIASNTDPEMQRQFSSLRKLINRDEVWRCPYCRNTIFFVGQLGKGTVIEVKCKKCKQYPVFAVIG